MDPVDKKGPGPQRGSIDPGSMFCAFPSEPEQNHISLYIR